MTTFTVSNCGWEGLAGETKESKATIIVLIQTLGSLENGDASQGGSEKQNWDVMEKEMIRPVTSQNLSINLWVHSLRFSSVCLLLIDDGYECTYVCACTLIHMHSPVEVTTWPWVSFFLAPYHFSVFLAASVTDAEFCDYVTLLLPSGVTLLSL